MSAFDIDGDLVRKLAQLLDETGLGEIEFADGDRRIRVTRPAAPAVAAMVAPAAIAGAPAEADRSAAQAGPASGAVTSPMVGTAYLSPAPGQPPFVRVGDVVAEGDTVIIVEAMKVMNPIRAPQAGTIRSIAITDGQPVEFGEVLFVVES